MLTIKNFGGSEIILDDFIAELKQSFGFILSILKHQTENK
jgi:hypothetical protein